MNSNEGIICFCHRKSLTDLRSDLAEHGSLARVQEETHVGLACGGCRAMLQHHFGESPAEIYDLSTDQRRGTTVCMKPGNRVMKGFIASTSLLESHVFSCNAVPLQLGACDATMNVEFSIYNQLGKQIYTRHHRIQTGDTFHFDTAAVGLPRPFFGMATYSIERQNYGASRFNVSWYTNESATSTHENFSTGRPDVVLPLAFDERFLSGPNTVYLAIQNPHPGEREVHFRVFRLDTGEIYEAALNAATRTRSRAAVESVRKLPTLGTMWVNVQEELIFPAQKKLGAGVPLALRIYTPVQSIHQALSMYFFFHHRPTNIWSANHL